MTDPRPYVLPDWLTRRGGSTPKGEERKPWMRRRQKEDIRAYFNRMYHTCVHCGEFDRDIDKLKDHEDACTSRPTDR